MSSAHAMCVFIYIQNAAFYVNGFSTLMIFAFSILIKSEKKLNIIFEEKAVIFFTIL
jgi:hypothetical protein